MPAWVGLATILTAVWVACWAIRDAQRQDAAWVDDYDEHGAFVGTPLDNAERKVR